MRAYADHMLTAEFQAAISDLMHLAISSPTAILCAEAVPWRCHRQRIADALMAKGWEVRHIMGSSRTRSHRMPDFVKVEAGQVTYPCGMLF